MRLYITGRSLATFTGYSGIDPELQDVGFETGVDGIGYYPRTKSMAIGLIVGFQKLLRMKEMKLTKWSLYAAVVMATSFSGCTTLDETLYSELNKINLPGNRKAGTDMMVAITSDSIIIPGQPMNHVSVQHGRSFEQAWE